MANRNPSGPCFTEFKEGNIPAAIGSRSLTKAGNQAVVMIAEFYEGMLHSAAHVDVSQVRHSTERDQSLRAYLAMILVASFEEFLVTYRSIGHDVVAPELQQEKLGKLPYSTILRLVVV